MPKYDAENFDPPAPVAHVTLRDPETGASVSNVPMLLDTGADVSIIPGDVLEELGASPSEGETYEVQGFSGDSQMIKAVTLEMTFLGKRFTGQFLVAEQPMGILGRNILNSVSILFDGSHLKWDEQKR
ncbi:MAG TPA: retropepsin-like aspartic protease [Anaerolineales bacterium]|nr:retropepsin-like aspartic protease [Anaerolineales bacterium]